MSYPYFGNNSQFYMQDLQNMRDRIDNQMRQIQQNQAQQPIQQPITQNFQLAPTQSNSDVEGKYAETIDEVKNTFVIKTGIFVNKDYSTLWIKDVSGNIRTFSTQELIELDPKDKQILELQKQIEDMKGMILNAKSVDVNVDGTTSKKKPTKLSNDTTSNEK